MAFLPCPRAACLDGSGLVLAGSTGNSQLHTSEGPPILHSHPVHLSVRKPVNFFLSQSAFPPSPATTRHSLHTYPRDIFLPSFSSLTSCPTTEVRWGFHPFDHSSHATIIQGARGLFASRDSRTYSLNILRSSFLPSNRIHRGAIFSVESRFWYVPSLSTVLEAGTTCVLLLRVFVFHISVSSIFPSYPTEMMSPRAPVTTTKFSAQRTSL